MSAPSKNNSSTPEATVSAGARASGDEACQASCKKNTDAQSAESFSPFAGCSIFIIAGVIAAGMIAFLIWSYFQTQDMVEGFTAPQPKNVPVESLSGKEKQLVDLKSKLVGFRHNIEARHPAEISLNVEEMNLSIAAFDILKPHRNALFIKSIKPDGIHAQISFPTRWKMLTDEKRHINAEITIVPELVDGAAFPAITHIQTDKGAEVPDEFKKFISETLLTPLYEDKEIGDTFKGLSHVEINGNLLILKTNPDYKAPAATPENTKTSTEFAIDRALKGFAVIAIVFLVIIAIVIILSRRKKLAE